MNLAQAFPERAVTDRMTEAAWLICKDDAALRNYFTGGIFRRHLFVAKAEGNFPQLIVASIYDLEAHAFSKRIKGEHKLGFLVCFQDFARNLDAGQPGIETALAYIQTLMDSQPNQDLGGLSYSHDWAPINPIPMEVGGNITAFAVGVEATYKYRAQFPSRRPANIAALPR